MGYSKFETNLGYMRPCLFGCLVCYVFVLFFDTDCDYIALDGLELNTHMSVVGGLSVCCEYVFLSLVDK